MLEDLVFKFEDVFALIFLFHLQGHVHAQRAIKSLINVTYTRSDKSDE